MAEQKKCSICGNELIDAVDIEGAALVLIHNPKLYGATWGHVKDLKKGEKTYEVVRLLLGARQLHADVCKPQTRITTATEEWV